MYVEMRTYTAAPGRAAEFLKLYEDLALALQKKYLGNLIGFFVTEVGPLNQIVHLWGYESLADRETRRGRLDADPEWAKFRAALAQSTAILQQESKIMKSVSFSPL